MGENQKDNVFTVYSSGDQLIVVDNSGKTLGILLAMGAGYGGFKLYKNRKKENEEEATT